MSDQSWSGGEGARALAFSHDLSAMRLTLLSVTFYLYDSHGKWVGFRTSEQDRYLYNKSGKWIGWFPWGDEDAVTKSGKYLGTVVGNRLLSRRSQPYRGYPGYPGYPGFAGYQPNPAVCQT